MDFNIAILFILFGVIFIIVKQKHESVISIISSKLLAGVFLMPVVLFQCCFFLA